MERFDFLCSTRVIFGRGRFAELGALAGSLGRCALVIGNGPDAAQADGPAHRAGEMLTAAGLKWAFLRQTGEPRAADVERGVELGRRMGCDVVVGLGGGSAIDAAKAVAGVLANGGSPLDYMEIVGEGLKFARPAIPWIAVPTTAGTGAEVTRNAVIACPEKHFKASLRSEHLAARVALVDPELGAGVSEEVTARCGMDALCQLVESYTSKAAGPVTDALAIKGIGLAGGSLWRAYSHPGDLDARSDMALAALLSGMALANAGLGAVHGFAAPLGANFPIPHGVVCAALLPHVMSANVQALRRESPEHPWLWRYARIGEAITGQHALGLGAVEAGIRSVGDLVARLNIPSLGRFGLAQRDIPGMVVLAKQSGSMKYNPVTLSDELLGEVLRKAL
jgi:alcohol dehydrogenase class IV